MNVFKKFAAMTLASAVVLRYPRRLWQQRRRYRSTGWQRRSSGGNRRRNQGHLRDLRRCISGYPEAGALGS